MIKFIQILKYMKQYYLQKIFKICLEMVHTNFRRVTTSGEKGRGKGWESGL